MKCLRGLFGLILYQFTSAQEFNLQFQNWGIDAIQASVDKDKFPVKQRILLAIVDTGIDVSHPSLQPFVWVNPGESGMGVDGRDQSTNGVDDDGNGFIDDVNGWNFVENNNQVDDDNGHGTHIAGIIAGKTGVNTSPDSVQLMIVRYYKEGLSGEESLRNSIRAVRYAIAMNARIINYSAGGTDYDGREYTVIKEAAEKNILFVAAAGNESSNSDRHPYYPADYELPNILSVTAVDPRTMVLPSSNYGQRTVDIAAPGQKIFSTLPGGKFGTMTGTSQATAYVSATAAKLMSSAATMLNTSDVIERLGQSGQWGQQLEGKTRFATKLDTFRSLALKTQQTTWSGFYVDKIPQQISELINLEGLY